jgi:[glutamine synthetase] adenylyltransferase / [glutamine synthetase]-adenylyl-L-tyrosine phosphorylase
VIAEFQLVHGRVPNSELVILALGRMGGAELTHASDLDLIYLFTGDFAAESDGEKPLGAVRYYNRLAQRVTAGLSVPTAAGALYDVDTRLRPSGAQGPLVVSLDGFQRYQMEDAWTWEHMALMRARVVYGSDAARRQTDKIILEVFEKNRNKSEIIRDAVKMRADIARHKPPRSELDVKLLGGGLVDLEFCVHVLQLQHRTAFYPALGSAIHALWEQGLMPSDMADHYRFLTRLLVTLRLVSPDLEVPDPATCAIIARACQVKDWPSLLERLGAARQSVSEVWKRLTTDMQGE